MLSDFTGLQSLCNFVLKTTNFTYFYIEQKIAKQGRRKLNQVTDNIKL